MRSVKISSLAIASAIAVAGISLPASAAITFLDHFNGQTNFTLNPSQGDYAAGSGTAVVNGSPGTATGFFGGADLAYHGTAGDQYVDINGVGNIQYTSTTTGGFTVGLWFKMASSNPSYYGIGYLATLGTPHNGGDDNLELSNGEGTTNTARATFYNAGYTSVSSESSVVNVSNWVYLAATVDLTNQTMTRYLFDNTGTLLGSGAVSIPVNVSFDYNIKNNGGVRIGQYLDTADGTTDVWIDELSIDNEALSGSAIQARVDSMVAGHELAVPEPATLSLLGVGGLLLIRRKRKAS